MKRSEINAILESAAAFLAECRFALPAWAYFRPADWARYGKEAEEIFANALGWDVTDFGSGDFPRRGLFLFTLRNGNLERDKKPYAEKIMVVEENQETPLHFHFHKMEDIINRGGAKLVIELHAADEREGLSPGTLEVSVDGIRRKIDAGDRVVLGRGESICLEQGVYHRFWAEGGRTLVGEVSMANDDVNDNRFLEPVGRFPAIEENVEPLRLLVGDYRRFVKAAGGRP